MERLTAPVSNFFASNFSFKTCSPKNTHKFQINCSKYQKNSSIPLYLHFSTRNVHVSACFGRPTSRRNSLRKKLLDYQKVLQMNPISLNSISDFENTNFDSDNFNDSQENLEYARVKESGSSYGVDSDEVEAEVAIGSEGKRKKLGESILLTKLENWADQCKKDAVYWGIGYNPIFTVFHDLEGNVKRVVVNEDEILKRSKVDKGEVEELAEVKSKILCAKGLAREMETGGNVIPRNSSVAKFIVLGENSGSGFVNATHGVMNHPEFVPVLSRVGQMVFCGIVAIWAVKKFFSFSKEEEIYTDLEKEMMRRKIKSRKEKEMLEKGRVEVVQEPLEPVMASIEKPKLDKQELMKSILEAKTSNGKLALVDSSSSQTAKTIDVAGEVQEIREMARKAREFESGKQSRVKIDIKEQQPINEESCSKMPVVEGCREDVSFICDAHDEDSGERIDMHETRATTSLVELSNDDNGKSSSDESVVMQMTGALKYGQPMVRGEIIQTFDTSDGQSCMSNNQPSKVKLRVIRSVKEAREFLARKNDTNIQETRGATVAEDNIASSFLSDNLYGGGISQKVDMDGKRLEPLNQGKKLEYFPVMNGYEDSTPNESELVPAKNSDSKDSEVGQVHDLQEPGIFFSSDANGSSIDRGPSVKIENWVEKNFHEVEPILKKIGDGFKDNYTVASKKANGDSSIEISQLSYDVDDSELEWMKDDGLREIVFRVRDNELAGRDPFHLIDAEDKHKFFKGLEKKVAKETEKLTRVHEFLHANIENLNYGADGISVYDPPEKFMPRWKGPPLEKNPEFLNSFQEVRSTIFTGKPGTSYPLKKEDQNLPQKTTESPVSSSADPDLKNLWEKDPKDSKTIVEGSDGSIKVGKKSGKEYWQHTKKWSRGFLESYNAETDPEVKAIMKDIGKDLDRWITEEEIQKAAHQMNKIPERNKKFMEKKINKLKREMELFGPQAVVSKYREYAEEEEEDYLWWLDLPHVLCIELYTMQNGEQKIGFYSLVMAADLELEPKPCHVIAFEDAGDCKNLCYIIQAHMDMVGNGHAFIVPRPPKDAFREAKANGFGVTVIRKGELKLNIDQTLEEVEEQVTEIGSKMYHDKIMKERSVDISSLMKGVFGVDGQGNRTKRKRSKQNSKRTLKKPSKK